MARPNRRPPLRLSSLPIYSFELAPEGRCRMICCPECGMWRSVKRSMITPHRRPAPVRSVAERQPERVAVRPQTPWCKGSGQRLVRDVAFLTWLTAQENAQRQAGTQRNRQVVRRPKPPVPPALHRLASATRTA